MLCVCVHVHGDTCMRVWGYYGPISHWQMVGLAVV